MLFVLGDREWWYYDIYKINTITEAQLKVCDRRIAIHFPALNRELSVNRIQAIYNDDVLFTFYLDKPMYCNRLDYPTFNVVIRDWNEEPFNAKLSLATLKRLEKEQQMQLDKWRKEQLPLLLLELIADDVNKKITLCRINGELTVNYKSTSSDYELALSLNKFSTSHYNGLRQTVLNDNKQHLIKGAFDKLTKDEVNALGLTEMYNTYVEEEYF